MISLLRSLAAIASGAVLAGLTYLLGAAIALVAMHGMPLGSEGGPPTMGDLLAHLLLGAAAAYAGASLTARLDRANRTRNIPILGAAMSAVVLAGFSKPDSSWPYWFGFAMAAAAMLGCAARFFRDQRRVNDPTK